MMETEITKLVEYGVVGISIALIIALILIVKYLLENNTKREKELTEIICNHEVDTAKTNIDLTVAIKELSTIIREKIK